MNPSVSTRRAALEDLLALVCLVAIAVVLYLVEGVP